MNATRGPFSRCHPKESHVNRRNMLISATATALMAGVVAVSGTSTALGEDKSVSDPYSEGCVSCHVKDGPGDIGARLAAMGHRKVDRGLETIPGDCAECHSEDGGFTPLSEVVHLVHFDNAEKNPFVVEHGGECLHCHVIDPETGAASVKSGPRNW